MKEVKSKVNDQVDRESGEKTEEETSNLTGDYSNVAVLLFLYLLQGD